MSFVEQNIGIGSNKKAQMYWVLWENYPTSHLMYYLYKEFMFSISSFKSV